MMRHLRSLRTPRRQDGAIYIEFLIHIAIIVGMTALLLQLGRTFALYNVSFSASYSAAMHVATMPEAELLNALVAKPSTDQILTRMRDGGAIDVSEYPFFTMIVCFPNPSAPCAGTTRPTQIQVRVTHIHQDDIFPIFTGYTDPDMNHLFIAARARIPRVGFVSL